MSDEWPMPAGPFTGGCQCGAVRFRAEALHDNPHVCYCRMCQKATGNLFASLVGVLHENLTWTRGTPSRFRSSEHVDRGFCSNCGTPLFYQYLPGGRVGMTIGSFDEPHRIELRWQMGMEGKHPSLVSSRARWKRWARPRPRGRRAPGRHSQQQQPAPRPRHRRVDP